MRYVMLLLFAAGFASASAPAAELPADAPLVRPPQTGELHGAIEPAQKVLRVQAVSRVTKNAYPAKDWDPQTGAFRIPDLPGDATYDLCIETTDGRSIEGIDLDFADARLLRLADERRKQLDLPPEPPHAFSPDDVKEILAYLDGLRDFMDARRALYVRGHGRRATVLVEALRTRDFYAKANDQVIWRVELWYFEYHYGGWVQAEETNRVLHRQRIPYARWEKISIEYFPELSVSVQPSGYARKVAFRIPDAPDPTRGRVPGAGDKLENKPHVSGLDVKEADAGTGE